jgi:ABC-type multidrug transport system ATPase subunit
MEKSGYSPISLQNIRKSYGNTQALNDVSLNVERGELFGLIGPDGSGKTTLFRIIASLLTPDSGLAHVAGYDPATQYAALRAHIGYMPGRFSLYPDLTVQENLRFFATLHRASIARNYPLIAPIYRQIKPFKDRYAGQLSGGMKQKLALCCALIHKPSVLLLDEPTTGIDPVSRRELWDMLRSLASQGITLLVSTPYMDEALRCDRIALIRNGSLLSIATPQQIIHQFPQKLYQITLPSISPFSLRVNSSDLPLNAPASPLNRLRNDPAIASAYLFGPCAHITLAPNAAPPPDAQEITPTIEDCFIHLMTHHATSH